jgi:hypothetical protein
MTVLPIVLEHYFVIEHPIRASKTIKFTGMLREFHILHHCLCFGSKGGQNRGPLAPNQAAEYFHLRSLNLNLVVPR